MALPVGNQNKELDLVAKLLEKTIKELEETKQGFEELKLQDQERQKKFDDYFKNAMKTLDKKDFNPRIVVNSDDLEGVRREVGYIMRAFKDEFIEKQVPAKFWDFSKMELWLIISNVVIFILLGLSLKYNFISTKTLMTQNENIFQNQKVLYDLYRNETKFWYSKEQQKAFTSSVVNGQIESDIKADREKFKEQSKTKK